MTDDVKVNEIVNKVVQKIMETQTAGGERQLKPELGIFADMDDAVEAAFLAQKQLIQFNFEERGRFIQAMRDVLRDNAEMLAQMAVDETGMGNYEHKVLKNLLVADKTPGIEDLTSECMTGDHGLTLIELSPFGVIGSITPTTNPVETVICNAIGMIAAGNTVVFSPHPTARKTTIKTIELTNQALVAAGAPPNMLTTIENPTLEQTEKMIAHEKIRMLVATGGPAIVKKVLQSGKKAIGAGAGNPPVVVDETAIIEKAAQDIVNGASFDNNLPCIAEKEVLVVDSVADYLIFCMQGAGALLIEDKETLKRIEELLLVNDGKAINKDFVGKSAGYILDKLGIAHDDKVKLIIMETDVSHGFVQHELMMPVLPIVRVKDVDEAIEMAVKCEHGFRHTAMMHSQNISRLSKFAKLVQTTIFVKNGPSYAGIGFGGEGYTTFTIAGPTGEGLTSAKSFARRRRCILVDAFSIK